MNQTSDNRVSPEMIQVSGSLKATQPPTIGLVQCKALSPTELTKLFFHSVREGNTDQVTILLKVDSSLVSQLDEQLLCPLHYAIKCNRVEMVSLLVKSGANVNQKGKEGARPLHVAANLDLADILKELLASRKIRVDAIDDRGQTALHVACKRNNEAAVKILLSHKASLQSKEFDGSSVLHLPSKRNNLQLCQILTSDVALVTCKDKHGVTPLMVAAGESGEELLSHFVSVCKLSGTDVVQILNMQDVDGNSVMHYAARNNKAVMMEALFNCGANVNLQNSEKSTPLHVAATLGHGQTVSVLLKLGALSSFPDKSGRTPLHCCVIARQTEICDILLKAGADTRAVDFDFMTPFHWACRRGQIDEARKLLEADHGVIGLTDVLMRNGIHWAVLASNLELVRLLLSKIKSTATVSVGASDALINACDVNDKFPMHYAVEVNNAEITKLLLAQGGNFHAIDRDGRTPVQLAVKLGYETLVKEFWQQSESLKRQTLRHRDSKGMTSLLIAAEHGQAGVFQFLLTQGADFTVRDELGRSALMLSVGSGHLQIASVMIDKGVDVNSADANRNTALHYACNFTDSKDAKCVEILLENGAQLQHNYNGETPVDVAVLNNNRPVIDLLFSETHRNWVMSFRKDNGLTHLDILIQHSPQTAKIILDRCITESTSDKLDKNFLVAYNFFTLDPGPDDPASAQQRYLALRTMVEKRRMELLQHPVSQALLESKWSIARYFFWCDFLFYAIFLCCLTAFVSDNGPLPDYLIDSSTGCRNVSSNGAYTGTQQKLTDPKLILEKSIVIGLLSIRILVEFAKIIFKRVHYFKNYENFFFLGMYALTFAFIYPPDSEPCRYNWICGLFSVILAWSLLIFEFEHIPMMGIYSLMFQQVIFSLCKILLIFAFFIVGFATAFHIGLVSQTPYALMTYSILKTFDMTVGEMDFVTYFISGSSGDMQTGLLVVFVVFVIIMPIGLINLLVGVAVGDIEGILRNASLRLIEIRINLVYELETNLPRYFQRRMYKRFIQVYPNRIGNQVSEYLWPYGAQYREWLQRCADDKAETTQEERLESIDGAVQQLTTRVEEIHRAMKLR